MKKLIALVTLITGTIAMVSCGDDEPTPAGEVTITGIPAAAQVALGDDLVVTGVTLAAEDGIASFTVSVDGGAAIDLTGDAAGETSITVDVTFPTTGLSTGLKTLVFTLTDVNGEDVQVQHGLTIAEFGIVNVTENIDSDVTWESNKVYVLGGRITVLDGATLTIEPGTVIKGEAGTGANATALLVARGGTLIADGDPDNSGNPTPIIFTSVADEITPTNVAAGDYASPNLDPTVNGLWGGVLVLGNARINASVKDDNGDATGEFSSTVQIEGIPSSDSNGLYGGNTDTDNSGTIRYISIRHGGANIGNGNEINGLTLGGVGSATTIEHIEIISNQDDGVEWFGGAVNTSNVVVWNTGDDGVDTDQSYSGTVDNFIVIAAGDEGMELDGPEGPVDGAGALKEGSHVFTNGTIVGSNDAQTSDGLIDLDDNTGVSLTDIAFIDIVAGQDIDRVSCPEITGGCPFSGLQLVVPAGSALGDFFDGGVAPAGASAVTTPTVGADASVFGWTWTSEAGALSGL
ncbi:MAG: hypothetical protein Tsb0034_18430 [Ekhidna sp.]